MSRPKARAKRARKADCRTVRFINGGFPPATVVPRDFSHRGVLSLDLGNIPDDRLKLIFEDACFRYMGNA